jgi:membrane protease YdiL (CAAX protease family)
VNLTIEEQNDIIKPIIVLTTICKYVTLKGNHMVNQSTPYDSKNLNHFIQNGTIQPLMLVSLLMARSLLILLGQAITALVFWIQGNPEPWLTSVPYWNVSGSLADIGCLILLHYLLKKEGLSIIDLIRAPKIPIWRDILIGVGLFLLIFPTIILGVTVLANLLIYGALEPAIESGLLIARQLPIWATLYSFVVWWVIWSPTESTFYNGYLFPRFEALTGRSWIAILVVGFFWTFQHIFLPFIPDWRYLAWRFLQFLGIGLLMPWLFTRFRRLRPLIITHWLMDISSLFFTIQF